MHLSQVNSLRWLRCFLTGSFWNLRGKWDMQDKWTQQTCDTYSLICWMVWLPITLCQSSAHPDSHPVKGNMRHLVMRILDIYCSDNTDYIKASWYNTHYCWNYDMNVTNGLPLSEPACWLNLHRRSLKLNWGYQIWIIGMQVQFLQTYDI